MKIWYWVLQSFLQAEQSHCLQALLTGCVSQLTAVFVAFPWTCSCWHFIMWIQSRPGSADTREMDCAWSRTIASLSPPAVLQFPKPGKLLALLAARWRADSYLARTSSLFSGSCSPVSWSSGCALVTFLLAISKLFWMATLSSSVSSTPVNVVFADLPCALPGCCKRN